MSAALLLAIAAAALPEGSAHYRLELGGEQVGAARISIRCRGARCAVSWVSRARLPEEAGGTLDEARVELEVDRSGRSRGGAARVLRDGAERAVPGVAGAVPAMLLPVVLALGVEAADGCLDQYDEETGTPSRACVRPGRGVLLATLGRERMVITSAKDGFPSDIAIPGQRVRWIRAAAAEPPARPPRGFGTRVEGSADAGLFCGLPADPPPPAALTPLPPAEGEGESCRDITLDYLARAARAGFEGRVAVGVAWTGESLAWHAWAELREGERWIPVDPTFRELPARGPRFTVARYLPSDPVGRSRAGRRILACWGEPAHGRRRDGGG